MPPIWVTTKAQAAATRVDPVVVARQAVKRLTLPSPIIEMAPPAGSTQLIGLATWLWTGPAMWRTATATASAGTVRATATATPVKVVWDMGDGHSVTCDGPGMPYDPTDSNATTDCQYTWSHGGTYQTTAAIFWKVTWTATGAAGGGNFGLIAGPAARVAVRVTESQAVNTPTVQGA